MFESSIIPWTQQSCHDISAEGGLRSDKAVPHYVHLTYSAVQGFRVGIAVPSSAD